MSGQHVKPGYKRTEIGAIPEDWDCIKLKDVAKVKGGKRLPKGFGLIDTPNGYPYIRVSDMYSGGISIDDIHYVPDGAVPAIKNYRIYCDDIFISVAGTLGLVGKIPPELNGANLTENADRITEIQCDQGYLLYWLSFDIIQSSIASAMTVGAQPKLALGRIENFPLAIPYSKTEQRAIAEALADVDALLAAQDRLIAKKRAIKQAAMQDLLTGRVRLPGFVRKPGYKKAEVGVIPEDWGVRQLKDVAPLQRGFDLPFTRLRPGRFPVVYSNGVLSYHNKAIVKGPGVVTGRSGTIGVVHYVESDFWPHNTTLWVTDFKGNDPKFIYYLYVALKLNRFSGGSGVPTLNRNDVHAGAVVLPPLPEQRAIAAVLSDMDAEIAALERRRAKTQALKQGMMQELLTGRVRLVGIS